MHKLDSYVAKYGPEAGPKLYKTVQSRAAYIGASARRARIIEELTGKATRVRRPHETATPLFPEEAPLEVGEAPRRPVAELAT